MSETRDFLPFPFSTSGKEGQRVRKGTEKMKEREGTEGVVMGWVWKEGGGGRGYEKEERKGREGGRERKGGKRARGRERRERGRGGKGKREGRRVFEGRIETSHLRREAGRVHPCLHPATFSF